MSPRTASPMRHVRRQEAETVVAVVQASLLVPGCRSLKEKRSVVKSLVERCRSRFNASVAEVGALDLLQRSDVAAAFVANDRRFVAAEAESFLEHLRGCPDARLLDHRMDVL